MILYYTLESESEVTKITHMYHVGTTGYFVRADGVELGLQDIDKNEWENLTTKMFRDGKIYLTEHYSKNLFVVT